jgi:hypothetical protein
MSSPKVLDAAASSERLQVCKIRKAMMLKKKKCTYEHALYMYANTAVYYLQIQAIRLTLYLAALGHAKRVF